MFEVKKIQNLLKDSKIPNNAEMLECKKIAKGGLRILQKNCYRQSKNLEIFN